MSENADVMCTSTLEWDFVAINAGYGDSGFFFNESGLQWDEYSGDFGGWLGESFFFHFMLDLTPSSLLTSSFTIYPTPLTDPSLYSLFIMVLMDLCSACNWWHGIPQLFWKPAYYDAKYPSSCSEVDLFPVAILEY